MKTPYLDKEIDRLNWLKRDGSLSDYGKKHLDEYKAIKEALSIHLVSNCDAILEDASRFPDENIECDATKADIY